MKHFKNGTLFAVILMLASLSAAYGQNTPTDDAYTNTASPGTNYGTAVTLNVVSPSETGYIIFDLSTIPTGYTGAKVAKASLKLYVNTVTTAGSLNVDYINGTWSEKTITANLAPALGTTIAASVPLGKANVHDYILVDVTSAVVAWLNGSAANDGLAIVGNSPLSASFDSKENTAQSHSPELDIVFTSGGTITGVTAGSGLVGGGTKGNVTLSMLNTCSSGQILQWNGTTWACSNAGSGTVTGVTAGTDLTGGGTSGNVTLNLNTATTDGRYAQLGAANAFTKNNSFAGTVGVGTTAPSAQLDVEAPATAATGIQGVTSSTTFFSAGVFGHATGTSGVTRGVYGVSDSPSGIGVHGIAQIGGQFETGNGTIFIGRGQGANRVIIDSLGNTSTTGGITAGGAIHASGAISTEGGLFATVTGGATGLIATSDTGTGVVGNGSTGVLGGSTSGVGVFGSTNGTFGIGVQGASANATAVRGDDAGSGTGVMGTSKTGAGVFGKTSASGGSANGVQGFSSNATAVRGDDDGSGSGVVGTSVFGYGVFGASGSGFGVGTNGNVQQARGMGGWVKAMAYVDPAAQGGIAITLCYNSQATGATVSAPPCGFNITHLGVGHNIMDFGFQTSDRFVSATSAIGLGSSPVGIMVCTAVFTLCSANANQLETYSFYTSSNNATDDPFYIVVY